MEATIYNQKGKETGTVKLPESVFGLPWNADLVHQVVTSMMANAREPIAHTKTRGEVRGGGKKPWQQKGTGRARHGSSRSPIWVGGGITHGPRNDKDYSKKINKKMKAKALYTILSKKFKEGEVLFVDNVKLDETKTKFAKEVLHTFGGISGFNQMTSRKNAAIIAFPKATTDIKRSFNNFKNIEVYDTRNINPVSLLSYKYLVITEPKESMNFFKEKINKKSMTKN